jgi:hypothetical protein
MHWRAGTAALLPLVLTTLQACTKAPEKMAASAPPERVHPTAEIPTPAGQSDASAGLASPESGAVTFTDITAQAGIDFVHFSGARGRKYMAECETPGCAFLDYDNDGRPDILLLNGADWPEVTTGRKKTTPRLFHNEGGGKFRDVTAGSGLDIEMHTMGCAVGDYDNDGRDDIYITCVLGDSRLFHNEGGGRFKDVTPASGLANRGRWGSAAAWFDYDRDGKLDLAVGNYCRWTPKTDIFCTVYRGKKSYCTPNVYEGESLRLFHNDGGGRFTDVTDKSGFKYLPGKTWGFAVLDFDDDGWPDVAVANDMEPNCLFHNQKDGTFKEIGLMAGIALAESGNAKAGMGIDAADIDNSGRESILISNFSGEGVSLFRNTDGRQFMDISRAAGMHDPSYLRMGWGLFFFDYDLDGRKDALVCNGHLYENVQQFQPDVKFAEEPLLYRNDGNLKFTEVASKKGGLAKPVVARGASFADIDGDGDLDVLICELDGRARLLRNDGGNRNHWLRVKLQGTKSNRNGYGAKIEVTARGVRQMVRVRSGSSFLSALEQTATIGMGTADTAEELKITWPGGIVETFRNVPVNHLILATEGVGAKAYPKQNLRGTPVTLKP